MLLQYQNYLQTKVKHIDPRCIMNVVEFKNDKS